MPWGEAYRLTRELMNDPSSRLAAAVAGWAHPWSREWAAIVDLYDLLHMAHANGRKRPDPYPRPWPDKSKTRRTKPTVSQEAVIAALRQAGHTAPLPTRPRGVTYG